MIPSANIIVGFNSEALRKLLLKDNSLTSLIKSIEDSDDLLLFNNQSNPNFISFSHELGGSNEMLIELIDPEGVFEKRIISTNSADLFAGNLNFLDDTEPDKKLAGTIATQAQQLEKHKDFYKAFMARFEEKASDYQNKLFVTYGVGDDISLWSGPHVIQIVGIELSEDGASKLTIKGVAEPKSLSKAYRTDLTNRPVDLLLDGVTYDLEANSGDFDFLSVLEGKTTKVYKSSNTAGLDMSEPDIDLHLLLVDTLKNYVKKATGNPNVIILLPDCNKLLSEYFGVLLQNSPGLAGLLQGAATKSLLNIVDGITKNKIISAYIKAKKACSAFGFHLASKDRDGQDIFNKQVRVEESRNFENPKAKLEHFLKKKLFYATMNTTSTKGIPDHEKSIRDLVNKIYKNAKGLNFSKFTFNIFYETDQNLVDFWSNKEQYTQNSPFNYQNKPFRKDRPVIVMGDRELINKYLYGLGGETVDYKPPMHPRDERCFSLDYRRKVFEVVRKKYANAGPFGDLTFIPDDFMYVDDDINRRDGLKQSLIDNNINVFRYNTSNPNVIDMKFDFSPVYWAELTNVFAKSVLQKASASYEGVISNKYTKFNLPTPESVIAYIRNRHNSLGNSEKAKEEIIKELVSKQGNTNSLPKLVQSTLQAQALYAYYDIMLKKGGDSAAYKIDQLLPGDPITQLSEFAEQLYKQALSITIKTLPAFHISSYADISSPILLFSRFNPVKSARTPENSLADTFLSGFYLITRARHTIENGAMVSEFDLTKQEMLTALAADQEEDTFEIE